MMGGIHAWEGLTAGGLPEAGTAFFPEDASIGELISLAWQLEAGSRRFYEASGSRMADKEGRELLTKLAFAEQHHQQTLEDLYASFTGSAYGDGATPPRLANAVAGDHMESGVGVDDALAWTEGKGIHEFLDLSLSLEAASYDLYLRMEQKTEAEQAKKVFSVLSGEEKKHLALLADLLDRKA